MFGSNELRGEGMDDINRNIPFWTKWVRQVTSWGGGKLGEGQLCIRYYLLHFKWHFDYLFPAFVLAVSWAFHCWSLTYLFVTDIPLITKYTNILSRTDAWFPRWVVFGWYTYSGRFCLSSISLEIFVLKNLLRHSLCHPAEEKSSWSIVSGICVHTLSSR